MSNELAQETSPYLQQHANNPVHWQPWSETALERARDEGKPILLSIGYSACHWCHVMAHESFEDQETADLMNRLYVNIKVDREERPDIDKIYQTAHQLFTGRGGGWPLTAFLTPDDHVPIVVGTYFPKEARYGMPAFKQVLTQVEAYYREHPDDIDARGNALLDAFGKMEAGETSTAAALTDAPLRKARERLAASFDPKHGGFGGAPKFPRATSLEFLLEQSRQADARREDKAGGQSADALDIVTHTLNRMALGGLYDHLGGGFFRYSVDERWSIPHFEKMLYDNAELLTLYGDAYAATGDPLYADVAAETADWVMRDMQDTEGGYYATLDADSEGQEGRFYLWTPEQLDEFLTPAEASVSKRVYGLRNAPNFADPHSGTKAWHLQIAASLDEIEAEAGAVSDTVSGTSKELGRLLESARLKLLEARRQRIWPGRDEKLLVSWNGLMIRGMARTARHLGRPELAQSATRAVDFIQKRMWKDGRLLATYKDGRARFAAYLDDYAFLADGLLELLQCRWRTQDLLFAVELADVTLARFEDNRNGGFFFTADDHEKLIHRPKPLADEAVPSGNGVLLRVLLKLGHLLGEQRYIDAAERSLAASVPMLESYPDAHASLLLALTRYLHPPESIIVRGEAEALGSWRSLLDGGYHPNRSSFCIPGDAGPLPGLLAERTSRPETLAYVCEGVQCLAPVTSLEALRAMLNERTAAPQSGPGV